MTTHIHGRNTIAIL